MQIIDAQIHLWGSGLPSNLSHRQVTAFTPEEAVPLMDEGGIDAVVIHPPGWDPGSTDMAFRAVRDYPGRFAIMGSVPLDRRNPAPASPAGENSRACSACGTGSSRTRRGMAARRHARLALGGRRGRRRSDRRAGDGFLTELGRIAERHPGLRLTIDHLGGRGGTSALKDAAAMAHMPELLALAKLPNIAVKATGVPHYSSEAYPFPGMHVYLRQVYDAFGPRAHVLGHRHHQDALLLARMRDDVHRGAAMADGPRQGAGHG